MTGWTAGHIPDQHGRVAVVTGANSGLGLVTANELARRGAHVVLAVRNTAAGEEAAHRIGGDVEVRELDLASLDSVRAFAAKVGVDHPAIDLLVNNAGFCVAPAAAEESSLDQARAIFDTNFFGIVRMTRAVLPHMRQQGSGRIINIGSVLGFLPMPYMALYSATKHAVRVLTEGLRQEVKPYDIRTTIVSPGAVATELPDSITESDVQSGVKAFYEIAIPADSFARAVVYALSQPDDVDINEILFRPTKQEY